MKHYLLVYFLLIVYPVIATAAEENKKIEPAQKFILKIDNSVHEISINKDHNVVVGGKPHKVRINLSPIRRFNKAGLSFDFDAKRHFSYEELSPLVDHWSLDGNNSVIIIQDYKVSVENSEIIESFKEQYNKMKAKTKWAKTRLNYGNRTVKGERLLINMGDIELEQQIFFFKSNDGTRVMILQDAPQDDNQNTEEFISMRKLVEKSLSVDQK